MAERPPAGDDPRVVELLRVNGELAAELRDLDRGRRERPRAGQVPAARSVAKLGAERDLLAGQLEASRAEVERLTRNDEAQTRHIEELTAEVARLRDGVAGILRRARARLLNR
jgi:hypothetical protein